MESLCPSVCLYSVRLTYTITRHATGVGVGYFAAQGHKPCFHQAMSLRSAELGQSTNTTHKSACTVVIFAHHLCRIHATHTDKLFSCTFMAFMQKNGLLLGGKKGIFRSLPSPPPPHSITFFCYVLLKGHCEPFHCFYFFFSKCQVAVNFVTEQIRLAVLDFKNLLTYCHFRKCCDIMVS